MNPGSGILEPKIEVLDAGAMIAFLDDEPGAEVIEVLLLDRDTICIAHAVNVCEVFYDFYRDHGEEIAQEQIRRIQDIGVEIRNDMDPAFWQQAGRLKVDPGGISLADCFLIALTQRVGGELVTADHHEMDRLVPLNLCPILFFR